MFFKLVSSICFKKEILLLINVFFFSFIVILINQLSTVENFSVKDNIPVVYYAKFYHLWSIFIYLQSVAYSKYFDDLMTVRRNRIQDYCAFYAKSVTGRKNQNPQQNNIIVKTMISNVVF
jgi:hypothetical protein